MDTKIVNRTPVSLADVAKIVKGLGNKPDRAEIQNKILDFAKDSAKLTTEKADKLAEELEELNVPLMTRKHIVQIIDILPKEIGELRSIFVSSKLTVSPENLKQMQDVISKYL